MTAKKRYDELSGERSQFLNVAEQAADLTLPYLIRGEEQSTVGMRHLPTPWQSVGAKGVVTLSAKLMLALLPPQTSFFKLQVDESMLGQFAPEVKSELDLSFSKIERVILDAVAASDDRVVVHQAIKHLVVAGNALVFMSKNGLKLYPLNRYVCERDGNGNVVEIVTKELINKDILDEVFPGYKPTRPESVSDSTVGIGEDVEVYTHIKRVDSKFNWHQEIDGKIIPRTKGTSPLDTNPWIALRFNTVDGEAYGRGRVEEFLGDLKSLEALSQAICEGSAAAAKVVFTVSPSSTTKPSTLAAAGKGAIVQGRPDDIGVVQVGKTADFATAYQMIQTLERRLAEAFLVLSVRQSERTTAEEVRMTQFELEQQLGGLFSLLTVDFLVPYLNRKLKTFQSSGKIPKIPKDVVNITIVAGINALGRGQDRDSLTQFLQTVAGTMGPEAISQYINPLEVVKRLAAAQGIDVLNLVKTDQQMQQEMQSQMQQQQDMEMTKQAGKFAQVNQSAAEAEMAAQQP